MKRPGHPVLSTFGEAAVAQYAQYVHDEQDLSPATVRSYLSELRQFAAWCEARWAAGQEQGLPFTPMAVTVPLLTQYRAHLQTVLRLQPTTINRSLVGLKRYFAWATDVGLIERDPARVVKLIAQVNRPPRQLTDHEEHALVSAVTAAGSVRDRMIIILLLHTGLRAQEVCALRRTDVTLGKRSGLLHVRGKRNKYREVPLNATVRDALQEYLATVSADAPALFCSHKTGGALTERALGYLIAKYAARAQVAAVSPHALHHRFGYRMAAAVPLHRLAQIMGHDSLDTTLRYTRGTRTDLQTEVEKIAWT